MDASLVEARQPTTRASLRHYALAIGLSLVGGLFGIPFAFLAETHLSPSLALFFLGPPIAEEILKPLGLYVLLYRWPFVVSKQVAIATLSSISGIVFGLLESTVYVTVYFPHHSRSFFIYRFTVNVLLHGLFSFIYGLGVTRSVIDWATRGKAFPKSSLGPFITAIWLHTAYNLLAVVLALTGVLDFD
jgi:hypothetical protein